MAGAFGCGCERAAVVVMELANHQGGKVVVVESGAPRFYVQKEILEELDGDVLCGGVLALLSAGEARKRRYSVRDSFVFLKQCAKQDSNASNYTKASGEDARAWRTGGRGGAASRRSPPSCRRGSCSDGGGPDSSSRARCRRCAGA